MTPQLTDETALAKKATDVVTEVKKVALLASKMVCASLFSGVSIPARLADCLKVLIKTKMSSTPIPIITKAETIVSMLRDSIPVCVCVCVCVCV